MGVDSKQVDSSIQEGAAAKRRWLPGSKAMGINAASIVALMGLWWALSFAFPPTVLPSPAATFESFYVKIIAEGILWENFRATMTRVGVSLTLAMVIGVSVGVALGLWRRIDQIFSLWVMVALTIPGLCYVVLAFLWLGLNERGAILAITAAVWPIISINIWSGVKSIDNRLVLMARAYRMPPHRRLLKVVLPQVLPFVMAATRFGLGIVWKVTVVVELLGRSNGVGFQLSYWWQLYDMKQVFAWTLFFTIVMLTIELGILKPIEHTLFKWRPQIRF